MTTIVLMALMIGLILRASVASVEERKKAYDGAGGGAPEPVPVKIRFLNLTDKKLKLGQTTTVAMSGGGFKPPDLTAFLWSHAADLGSAEEVAPGPHGTHLPNHVLNAYCTIDTYCDVYGWSPPPTGQIPANADTYWTDFVRIRFEVEHSGSQDLGLDIEFEQDSFLGDFNGDIIVLVRSEPDGANTKYTAHAYIEYTDWPGAVNTYWATRTDTNTST